MPEAVRLVIWDLDETFWKGTLTEGGITEYVQAHHDAVIELARRGIMNSIVSKNDFTDVKTILQDRGIWDYFIFPSIDWLPKGPRIHALIEAVQLRPSTILFIDDNPSNLGEVKAMIPGIQVQPETFIPLMLSDALFAGKDDKDLGRLAQYKLLEKRKADEAAAGADVTVFLHDSNIRVELDFDVEKHLDRAIELINRTNQLNFTKVRLSEDIEEARKELRATLAIFSRQAAMVRVTDRYGDHGYCGFYLHNSESRHLEQFCFSCRILGMGVERWLFNKLKRPNIKVSGEVLTNIWDVEPRVAWINQTDKGENVSHTSTGSRITARGACDLGAVVHYFVATHPDSVGEYHEFRNGGFAYRVDHSTFLTHAIEGLSEEALGVAKRLGYQEKDFNSRIVAPYDGEQIILLGVSTDCHISRYRHRETGLVIPVDLGYRAWGNINDYPLDAIPEDYRAAWSDAKTEFFVKTREFLVNEFDYLGIMGEAEFKVNWSLILNHIPKTAKVFLILPSEQAPKAGHVGKNLLDVNRWARELASHQAHVSIIQTSDYISNVDTDGTDVLHWNRTVYYGMYRDIMSRVEEPPERLAS